MIEEQQRQSAPVLSAELADEAEAELDQDPGNPLERALDLAAIGFGWTALLWWIGGALAAAKCVELPHVRDQPYSLLLAPVWVGDAVALGFQARILYIQFKVRFTSREKALLRRSYGATNAALPAVGVGGGLPEQRPGAMRAGHMLGRQSDGRIDVDEAYARVWHHIMCYVPITFVMLLLIVTWQALWCRRLHTGSPGPLVAASPLLTLEAACVTASILLRGRGPLNLGFWLLALALTIFVACKQAGTTAIADWPWVVVLAPLWALNTVFLLCLAYVGVNACLKKYLLTRRQAASLGMYTQALIAMTLGELMLSFPPVAQLTPRAAIFRIHIPVLLLLGGGGVALIAAFLVLQSELKRFYLILGYEAPKPLSESNGHWVHSGAGITVWALLGTVDKSGGQGGLRGTTQRARHYLGVNEASYRSIEEDSSPAFGAGGYEREGFSRTDSGQYDQVNWDSEG